jgi:iron complex outermembrane receptor protein
MRQAGDSPQAQSFVRSWVTLPRGFEIDFAVRHVGDLPNQRVPSYVTGDAHMGWQPSRGVEIGLHGRDLFAPQHAEFGQPATRKDVPRTFYGKITWRL